MMPSLRHVNQSLVILLMAHVLHAVTLENIDRPTQKNTTNCVLGGKIYEEGARWHPFLRPFGLMNCTTCYCLEGGEVTCWRESCPSVRCMNPVTRSGQCCPVCPADEDEEEDDIIEEEMSSLGLNIRRSCNHFGNIYRDGERFSSIRTALHPTKKNQCVLCVCLDGNVYCHLRTCFAHTCSQMFNVDDDCCPVCADCVTDDLIYKNGSTWHPVVEGVGKLPCVTCSCLNGEISCKKITCPSDTSLGCDNPDQLQKETCCKTCLTASNATTFSGRPENDPSILVPTDSSKRPVGTNNRILPGTPSPTTPGMACLPKGTDTFLHQWQNKTSVVIVFEFKITATVFRFDVIRNRVMEINSLCISKDKLNKLLSGRREATMVGATTIRRIEKFKRRVMRWFQECQQKKCRTRSIRRLIRVLRAKDAIYREHCI
ncbi:chordin-like protein 2 isoform X2 [Lineus longissimus]|uniref:chordin-like protein 2 isoform X2 n=1 Tax=Lineus longissimus TaxID=88925 RepID=UPI002B4DC64C